MVFSFPPSYPAIVSCPPFLRVLIQNAAHGSATNDPLGPEPYCRAPVLSSCGAEVGHGAERLHCRGCTPTVLQGALDSVLPSGSHKIQREQVLEYLFVREIRRPSVGREVR